MLDEIRDRFLKCAKSIYGYDSDGIFIQYEVRIKKSFY